MVSMDRFIGQPKFAGKTYIRFEGQESMQRIRQESLAKLPVSGSLIDMLINMHSIPLLFLLYTDKSFPGMHQTLYPIDYENCNCLHYPA